MPTKREKRTRNQRTRVTDAAVALWKQGDLSGLSLELKFKPWECDPGWCRSLWMQGGDPCSGEPHRGCHRAKEMRDELISRSGHVPNGEEVNG